MRIRVGRWAVLLIVCALLFSPFVFIHAQDGGLAESFDTPELPGWELSPDALVVDGVLHVPGGAFAFYNNGAWDNMSLSVQVRLVGEGETLIRYRASEDSNYHVLIGPSYIILSREADGAVTDMGAATEFAHPVSEWFQLGIAVTGGQHTITFDGVPILTVTDPAPLPPGSVSFHAMGAAAGEFDDLVISAGGESLPPADTTAPPEESAPAVSPAELTWVRTGGPPGGLGYDIRYNFADPNIWYVTDAYAGVHISTDNGYTWQPNTTGIPPQGGPTGDTIPIFSLTVDPHNPQIIWAGTDKTGHIYRSADGGYTWEQRDNGVSIGFAEGTLSFRGFTVDPRTSDIVYAMGELADLTRGGVTGWSQGIGGVVYKTTNSGASWELIWDGGIPSSLARYMWIDPRDPNVLYVSTGIFDRGAVNEGDPFTAPYPFGGLGILKSTDGGATWRFLNEANGLNFLYIGSLYMHPEDPDILLAAAGKGAPELAIEYMMANGLSPMGVYRTADGGETWTQVLARPDRAYESFTAVEICPSNPAIAYAASANAVYRSEDTGQTWTQVSSGEDSWGPPGVMAGRPIDMQCDPRDPNRIFANNYLGGNFLSEDGGHTWQNASDGYTGAQILSVAVNPANPAQIYSAGRNGIWASDNGGVTWHGIRYPPDQTVWGGEWGAIALDPTNPQHLLASEETIWESHDGGSSWQVNPAPPFVIAIDFAPSNPSTVYAGPGEYICRLWHVRCGPGQGLYVSHNGGAEWAPASDANIADQAILDIAIDPTNDQIVYVATQKGLFMTTNGGMNWTPVSGLPADTTVWAIAVNPFDAQYVLAGVHLQGAYLSTDGGQTWQAVVGGLEANNSLHDIVFDPTNPQIVYASDLLSGVYRSTDGGYTWVRINNGLLTRATTGLAISADGQHLYVATHGEGVFRLDFNGMPPQ